MITYNKDEDVLKKRLADLQKKYQENLFNNNEDFEKNIESEVQNHFEKKNLSMKNSEDKPLIFQDNSAKLKQNEINGRNLDSPDEENFAKFKKIVSLPEIVVFNEKDQQLKDFSRFDNNSRSKLNTNDIKNSALNIQKIKKEISKALIGQEETVLGLITGLLCNAHVLVEGVPGIAKTLAVRALGSVIGADVKRIQFTVDLLPTDITGITSYTPERGFETIKGPIFTNFLIADEINRAPPKTQSALMEAMQERQVTIGKENFQLPAPFFVMATENPIENAGVYPLPEAQVDRFLFKLVMGYPKLDDEKIVMESNMTLQKFEDFNLSAVVTPSLIVEMQQMARKIYCDDNIKSYILEIVRKTRDKNFSLSEYISYGTSPRASIGIFIASKARALIEGRNYVIPEDVKQVIYDVLRHRLILSYKATIKKITPEFVISTILNSIEVY
jgi:MoxR-like ATPase